MQKNRGQTLNTNTTVLYAPYPRDYILPIYIYFHPHPSTVVVYMVVICDLYFNIFIFLISPSLLSFHSLNLPSFSTHSFNLHPPGVQIVFLSIRQRQNARMACVYQVMSLFKQFSIFVSCFSVSSNPLKIILRAPFVEIVLFKLTNVSR